MFANIPKRIQCAKGKNELSRLTGSVTPHFEVCAHISVELLMGFFTLKKSCEESKGIAHFPAIFTSSSECIIIFESFCSHDAPTTLSTHEGNTNA